MVDEQRTSLQTLQAKFDSVQLLQEHLIDEVRAIRALLQERAVPAQAASTGATIQPDPLTALPRSLELARPDSEYLEQQRAAPLPGDMTRTCAKARCSPDQHPGRTHARAAVLAYATARLAAPLSVWKETRWNAGALLALALGCSWATLQLLAADLAWFAAAAAIVALSTMVGAFRLAPVMVAIAQEHRAQPGTLSRRHVGIGALVLAAALAVGAAIHLAQAPYLDWTLVLYPMALLIAWCGEGWLRGLTVQERIFGVGRRIAQHRVELTLLTALSGLGLLFRIWAILQYPFLHGTETDEVLTAASAWNLLHSTGQWPIYQISTGGVSIFQPIAASFALFGTSILSLRIPLVAESILLVPACYLLLRQFASAASALCATALLTFAYSATMQSLFAFGWMNGAVGEALGFGLLAYAMKRRCLTAAAASGAALALCLYCYGPSRLLPLPAALCLVPFLLGRDSPLVRRIMVGLGVAFGFAVAAAPFSGAVLSNSSLLHGNVDEKTRDFQVAWQHNPFQALVSLLDPAWRLLETVLATPRIDGGYFVARVWQGGLLDPLTATFVLLGLLYAFARWWRPENLLILAAMLVSLAIAASIQIQWVDTYRMVGIVPVMFLAVACVLDHSVAVLARLGAHPRWSLVALLAIAVLGSGANVRQVATRLGDCSATSVNYQLLSPETDEGVLMADKLNALGPGYASFIATRSFQVWLYYWMYHVRPPVEYSMLSGPSEDPARWQLMSYSTVLPSTSAGAARFWPPAVGRGQVAVNYIMPNGDARYLLPLLQRSYPRGTLQVWQNAVCPSFKTTVYTLTAQQIMLGQGAHESRN